MPAEARCAAKFLAGRFAIAAAVAATGLAGRAAHANDRYWIAGSGFWDVPSAWSATPAGPGGAGVPVNGDNAFIFSDVSLTVTRDNTVASYTAPGLNRLDLAGTGSFPATLAESANTMICATENVGTAGLGEYDQTGGTNTVTTLNLGTATSGKGVYNLSGGSTSILTASTLTIGGSNLSAGTFSQISGVATTTFVSLGAGTSSAGTFSLGGGTFTASTFTAGSTGTGTILLSGGTLAATSVSLGGFNGGAGTINVSNGTLSSTTLLLGTNGTGVGSVTGGTLNVSAITVGGNGIGTFTQSNGQTTVSTLNVFKGSRFTTTGGQLFTNGAVTVDAGTMTLASSLVLINNSPSLTVKNSGVVNIPSFGVLLDGTISLQSDALLNVGLDVSMFNANDRITLDGGRLNASTIGLNGGTVIFNSGTINLTGNGGLSIVANGVLGNAPDLTATRSLEINNTTTLVNNLSTVTLDGGTFSTGTLTGNGFVIFNSGTFRLTASDLLIGGGGAPFGNTFQVNPSMHVEVTGASNKAIVNSGALLYMNGGSLSATTITNNGEIQLASGASRIAGGTLTNNGLIDGSGRIDNPLVNPATGIVRAGTADHLVFTAANNTNGGSIQLLGGITEFQQSLANTGSISGRGTLIATGGWTNSASITLSGGPADVMGAGTNTSTAHVLVTGGANATFYNTVTNQSGSIFKVSNDSIATFLGPVSGLAAFTGAGTTIFESTTTPGPLAAGTSIVETTGNLSATSIRQPTLIIRGGAAIVPDGSSAGTSVLQTLSIDGSTDAWNGQLDLANNHLIVNYTGASPIATIANQIKSGAAGTWTGNGITSSSAHSVAISANPHKTALGYAEASSIGVTSFGGQTVDSTAVLIGYTYVGDANLDSKVNALDFNAVASNFGGSAEFWSQGDFNYDGVINTSDFTALAGNFNLSIAASPALGSLIPEPATVMLAPLAICMIRTRRRRNPAAL